MFIHANTKCIGSILMAAYVKVQNARPENMFVFVRAGIQSKLL
jgi:hypothetical protein